MNDWGMSVLSQYPVTVRTTRKVRGALLCDTKEGLYLLSEYRGKQARLEAEAALLLYLAENGMVHTDQIIKNEKEELLSKNEEGTGDVLKMWYPRTVVSFAVCVPICIVKRKNQCVSSSSKKALMKCIIRQTLQCVQ